MHPVCDPRHCTFVLLCALTSAGTSALADDPAAPSAILEPEREEIRTAYRAWIDALNERAVDLLGGQDAARVRLELQELQKLGCQRLDREPVQYDCRVEARLRVGDLRPRTRVVDLWVLRDGEGWVVR